MPYRLARVGHGQPCSRMLFLPDSKNDIYTRAVGFLLILAEVCTGVGSYIYQSTTRTFLEDSPLQVAASFPLNYWNIVMAILVLFSAEVFSIGSRLSEEQKLTI